VLHSSGVQTEYLPTTAESSVGCDLLCDSQPLKHISAQSTPLTSTGPCSQDSDFSYIPSQSELMECEDERYLQKSS